MQLGGLVGIFQCAKTALGHTYFVFIPFPLSLPLRRLPTHAPPPSSPTRATPTGLSTTNENENENAAYTYTRYKRDAHIAARLKMYVAVAAFTTCCGWGNELRNKHLETYFKTELKKAKAKGEGRDGKFSISQSQSQGQAN
eukprot:scaffold11146_cov106-Isochrysis_galbana.AAC.2